ncbi:hypothetical protein KJ633_01850 [bacterium]|nr:hypothetical protein [bacterium]
MWIDQNGNVGIGTTNPTLGKLQVDTTAGGTSLSLGDNTYSRLNISHPTGNYVTFTTTAEAQGYKFYQNSLNVLTIQSTTGNVGIGTTGPGEKFVVALTQNIGFASGVYPNYTRLFWESDGSGYGMAFSNKVAGTHYDRVVIKDNGNVGIGTTAPSYTLDVIGDIRATGSVLYGGTAGSANGTAYTKPDYVFEKGYKVMSTEAVEKFLKKEGHLPWLTSVRQEKAEYGDAVNMTRMSFETVETAENLQLQVIEQQKRIKRLEETIAKLVREFKK